MKKFKRKSIYTRAKKNLLFQRKNSEKGVTSYMKMCYFLIRVFIWVIGSVSNGYHSDRLYFRSVIFRIHVTTCHTRGRSVSHGSVED